MTIAGIDTDLVKLVRAALGDLYDLPALTASPLCARFGTDAPGLRATLRRAIEALKPVGPGSTEARAWRAYRLLDLRYVQGQDRAAVEQELSLGTSQYYRELQHALEGLVLHLEAEDGGAPQSAPQSPTRQNLPASLTSFVGRQDDVAAIRATFGRGRLITLAGAGGCGKTRLALETAARLSESYSDGVWLVDFTPLSEPRLVAQTVAFTLGVREAAGEPILASLTRWLGSKAMLIVFDNCEHLLAACAQVVTTILRECPRVQVLATSREVLGVTGEFVHQLAPLGLERNEQGYSEAVQLFYDRATAAAGDFIVEGDTHAAVALICERLDGLPLAIELAAARVRLLTPAQIALRLDDRFSLLHQSAGSAPHHHQTLSALLDWSYDLLSDEERRLFERLAIFTGGCSLDAVEQVCAEDETERTEMLGLLGSLVDKSLVLAEPTRFGMRYRFLETVRAYATQRLQQSNVAAMLADRHGAYYAALASHLEQGLYSFEQLGALRQIDLDHNNFRLVLSRAPAGGNAGLHASTVAASISLFWFLENYFSEARHWLDWVLSVQELHGTFEASRCLMVNGFLAASLGTHELAADMCARALREAEARGDAFGLAWAYFGQTATAFIQGDAATMQEAAARGVDASRAAAWPWGIAICSAYLGRALLMQRDLTRGAAQLQVAIDRSRAVGDPTTSALSLSFYAVAIGAQGDYQRAADALRESLDLFRQLRSLAQQSRVLVDWASIALRCGETRDAAVALTEGLDLADQLGHVPYRFAQLFAACAQLACMTGRAPDAARLLGAAEVLRALSRTAVPPERRQEEDAILGQLRAELGEAPVEQLLTLGRALPVADAVSYAQQLCREIIENAGVI